MCAKTGNLQKTTINKYFLITNLFLLYILNFQKNFKGTLLKNVAYCCETDTTAVKF